ncbi:uncharacterized protein LOC124365374 [Homalodisca vitripennis]|uniref:uncharacterized protein LOC124365374 n=1 Tax=Homalodisca vitripennis TaxID=197043 RepID=UPI001EECA5B0|nr:uncharacterized protein LOC124365374 [Homalodisca vitripennis]
MSQCTETVIKKRGRSRTRVISVPYTKVGEKGVPLRGQSRELVCRVKDYFKREKINKAPILPVEKVIVRTAAALEIGKNTVVRIGKEKIQSEQSGLKLNTPDKKYSRFKPVTKLDAFKKDAIRRHVYGFFVRREYPTVRKLQVSLAEADLFRGSKSSVAIILKRLGFKHKKFGSRKILMERGDIIAWRCRFLREIKDLNFEEIVWLDETWVNSGHCKKIGWTDDSVEGTFPVPVGKGRRIIVLHAGSSTGFIPNCALLFTSKKTKEYHEEMNHKVFFKWFQDAVLPNLTRPSLIVMDNAKYHSKVVDKPPNSSSRKDEIIEWLNNHDIQYEKAMLKAELLEIIQRNKPQTKYEVDEIAKKHGHRVLRLPPYHCHFNPIELIWAQVKEYVARSNRKFNITEKLQLTKEGLERVTESDWKKVVDHTKNIILDAWKNEGLMEDSVEQMVINIGNDSSSEEDSDSDSSDNEEEERGSNVSGIFPLSPVAERVLDFDEL